jgi:thioesterase domain-containing protein
LKWQERITFVRAAWRHHSNDLRALSAGERLPRLTRKTVRAAQKVLSVFSNSRDKPHPATAPGKHPAPENDIAQIHSNAFAGYVPRALSAGRTHLLWPDEIPLPNTADPSAGWRKVIRDVRLHRVPGAHFTSISGHNLRVTAEVMRDCLDEADA